MTELTVILPDKSDAWEYWCARCRSLRLSLSSAKPLICGNCGSDELLLGKPGELDADALREAKS